MNILLYFIGTLSTIGLMCLMFFNILLASEESKLMEETQE